MRFHMVSVPLRAAAEAPVLYHAGIEKLGGYIDYFMVWTKVVQ